MQYKYSVVKSCMVLLRSRFLLILYYPLPKTIIFLVHGCAWGFVTIKHLNMCFLRYVDTENKRLKKLKFIEKNFVYLFRIIYTCMELRYLLMSDVYFHVSETVIYSII